MKYVRLLCAMILIPTALAGCLSFIVRGHGPIDSYQFTAGANPALGKTLNGMLNELTDPMEIEVVVPPGTDVRGLVATLSLNTGVSVAVISSGKSVAQENGVTPNDFSAPVLYSIKTDKTNAVWQYKITVRQAETNAGIGGLSVTDAALMPAFSPKTREYSAEVPFATRTAHLRIRGQSTRLRSITVNGDTYPRSAVDASIDFSSGNEKSVLIETLAEDGVGSESCTVTLVRGAPDGNSFLDGLEIVGSRLEPAFSPTLSSYRVEVPFADKRVLLRARTHGRFAAVELATIIAANGAPARAALEYSGSPDAFMGAVIPFAGTHDLPVIVSVTAQDGSVRDYLLEIRRGEPDHNNVLMNLDVANGAMPPHFHPSIAAYTAVLPYRDSIATIFAQPQSKLARVAILGPDDFGRYVPIVKGDPASDKGAELNITKDRLSLYVAVTAQDGGERRYILELRRAEPDSNADLAVLSVSAGTLFPAFMPRVVSYTVDLPSEIEQVKIAAVTVSPLAAASEDNTRSQPGRTSELIFDVSVKPGSTTTITVTVTAENGAQKQYRVRISRAALPPPKP